jgi:hypothetical protein
MNSIDENYSHAVLLPAVLTFHFFKPQSLSMKPKRGGNHESQLNNFPHLRVHFVFLISISTNFLFSQTEEWNDSSNGNFILSLADDANYLWVGVGSCGLVKLNKTMCDIAYGQSFKLN